MVGGSGIRAAPAGRRTNVRLPTIAPDVGFPSDAAAPRAARLARPADQRAHLPRDLALRRVPAPVGGVHGRTTRGAPAPRAAGGLRPRRRDPAGSRSRERGAATVPP